MKELGGQKKKKIKIPGGGIIINNLVIKNKIPHTGITWPSRTSVIQEYRFYTGSLSQYHGCCHYHESLSIP